MSIIIANVNGPTPKADRHLYCGRLAPRYPHLTNAGLGNMHPVNMPCHKCGGIVHQRGEACAAYLNTIAGDNDHPHWKNIRRIASTVRSGLTVALYYHCSPSQCHCEVIKAAVEGILQHESQP